MKKIAHCICESEKQALASLKKVEKWCKKPYIMPSKANESCMVILAEVDDDIAEQAVLHFWRNGIQAVVLKDY